MTMESQYEREENAIIASEQRGEISHEEGMKQIRELWRDYREAAQEAASEAYFREMENW